MSPANLYLQHRLLLLEKCVNHYERVAKENALLITGGSDYHGFGSAGKELGYADFYLKVPYEVLENLKLRIKNEK